MDEGERELLREQMWYWPRDRKGGFLPRNSPLCEVDERILRILMKARLARQKQEEGMHPLAGCLVALGAILIVWWLLGVLVRGYLSDSFNF
jgi:hypothetical protein